MTDFSKPAWLRKGPDCDVVISSRLRVARNLRDSPFPNRLNEDDRVRVDKRVAEFTEGLIPVRLSDLSAAQRDQLAAVRLAPVAFVSAPDGFLLVDRKLAVSLLVNEEDHIRLQVIMPGSGVQAASSLAAAFEHLLSQNLPLAWNNDYGYLTASPMNAGSGVRASSLCHLVGLAAKKKLVRWLNAAADAGVVMRGVFGEGSRAVGGFFQLSVLGSRTETCEDAAGRLLAIVRLLVQAEREAREELGRGWADQMAGDCAEFVEEADRVTLGESLRVLGWWRLAAALRADDAARHVDAWSAEILIDKWRQQADADVVRASVLKNHLGGGT